MRKSTTLFAILLVMVSAFAFTSGCNSERDEEKNVAERNNTAVAKRNSDWRLKLLAANKKARDCRGYDNACISISKKECKETLEEILKVPRSFPELQEIFSMINYEEKFRDMVRKEMMKVAKEPEEYSFIYASYYVRYEDMPNINDPKYDDEKAKIVKIVMEAAGQDASQLKKVCKKFDVYLDMKIARMLSKSAKTFSDWDGVLDCSEDLDTQNDRKVIVMTIKLATSHQDVMKVLDRYDRGSLYYAVIYKKAVLTAKTSSDWIENFKNSPSLLDKKVALAKAISLAKTFSEWEDIYPLRKYHDFESGKDVYFPEAKIALRKMAETASTYEECKRLYDTAPEGSVERAIAFKKGEEFLNKKAM